MAYTLAAQLTTGQQAQFYTDTVADIVRYVSRDLTHPLGGFFSAEDADSWPEAERGATTSAGAPGHKKEGAFCVWTAAEIREILRDEEIPGSDANSLIYSGCDFLVEVYHQLPVPV